MTSDAHMHTFIMLMRMNARDFPMGVLQGVLFTKALISPVGCDDFSRLW